MFVSEVKAGLIKFVGAVVLFLVLGISHATTYTFPGNLPAECSGSNGTYVCRGLSLGYQDVIVIASPKPATITVKGDFNTNRNQINVGGTASDLTLNVTGTLTLGWKSQINANATAHEVNGGSLVIFGGTITARDDITLGSQTQVGGDVTSTSGQVKFDSSIVVNGNVSAAQDVTVGYQGQISGTVSSSSGQVKLESQVSVGNSVSADEDITLDSEAHVAGALTSSTGQVKLESRCMVGSIRTMTDGDVTVDYQSVVCGDIITRSGDVKLNTEIRVGGSITSDRGDITIGWHSSVAGSVTTRGSIQNNGGTINAAGLVLPAFCASLPPGGGTPSDFNAFDTTTAANAVKGFIKTKIAAEAFSVAVVALTTTSLVKTDFTGTVSVQLVNGSGSTDCASLAAIGSAGNVTFVSANQGRVNVPFTENNAWPDVAVRMTYTPASGSTVVACSTDHFAIRPYALGVAAMDGGWETAGTARALNNAAVIGGVTHKAGRPFTILATGYNKSNVVTSNYAGTPTTVVVNSALPYLEKCATCALSGVAFASSDTAGTVASTTTKYSEVGAFVLQLQDTQFAKIDASDEGSTLAERAIVSELITVGRFVPDHFTLREGSTVAAACAAGGFTYMDQPFGRLAFTVEARNVDEAVTQNYANTLAKGSVVVVSKNGNAGTSLQGRLESMPTATWSAGQYSINTADVYWRRQTLAKDGTIAPDGPFDSVQLGVRVDDTDDVVLDGRNLNAATTDDCVPAGNCDSERIGDNGGVAQPTKVRFGRLRLLNAYGSEKLKLPVPIRAQYYNGSFFVTNALDRCTVVSKNNVGMPSYRGGVSAANMTVDQNVTLGGAFVSGNGNLRLFPPNPRATRKGSVKICVALGSVSTAACSAAVPASMPWLQGRWLAGSSAYTDDPSALATFGVYKNDGGRGFTTIYMREMY